MSKLKGVNKKAVEANLRAALMGAFKKQDTEAFHKAANDIMNAGYELEDMKLTPGMFTLIANMLIATNWVPRLEGLE